MVKETKSKSKSKKTIEDEYQKMDPHDHVLKRPGMYIGSTKEQPEKMWIYNDSAKDDADPKMILKEISYVPGLYKICDEIYVNAADRTSQEISKKSKVKCTMIKFNVDKKEGRITVWNNGDGIPVVMHKKEKQLVPTMIFSNLLAGGNFDDDGERFTGGMNGLGAKLANIYSVEFELKTGDAIRKKKFYQKFTNNMYDKEDSIVKDYDGEPYTEISFVPDFKKFGLKGISSDMFNLLKKRAYDIAMTTGVKVYFNDKVIKQNTMEKYVELFFPVGAVDGEDQCPKVFDVKASSRWKVAMVFDKTNHFDHENNSFVNSICTSSGGTHVDHVVNQIVNRIKDIVGKKLKGVQVKPAMIKENLIFFVDSQINKPEFDSQSKEKLKMKPIDFGSEFKLTNAFFKSILETGIVDSILLKAETLANAGLNKMDGKKVADLRGFDKLSDANNAGTKKSKDCYLFLTEGDSAKALVMAGIGVIGRENFGVFPLKGKVKNMADENGIIDTEKLKQNKEIEAITKIIGLKYGKVYENTNELRYGGGIVIFTDQDEDGFHIKGLLINFIHRFWPSLINLEGFIKCFPTPIVKVRKGTGKKEQVISFYSLPDFEKWKEENNGGKGWDIKYYKGLATSDPEEAIEYFKEYYKNVLSYFCPKPKKNFDMDEKITDGTEMAYKPKFKDPTSESISLAFDKNRSKVDRKVWMNLYDPNDYIDTSEKRIAYPDFFNKEMRAFSLADLKRSIPNMMDGFKPTNAKIYYGCVLHNLYTKKKELRVAQLAGKVSELGYHHGEASLQGAIIKMAQQFVGSNNINLLVPSGQFGTRLEGGNDAGSSRYIHTYLEDIGKYIFIEDDFPVLRHQKDDDGKQMEPKWYAPIIPMLLVNGTAGIGTGWSSDIEPCNPRDIVDNLYRLLEGDKPKRMHPWYRHFTGKIEVDEEDRQRYHIKATYEIIDDDTIHITDLPIGVWTENYKSLLNKLMDEADKLKKAEKAESKKSPTTQKQTNAKGKGGKGAKGAKGKGARSKAKKDATKSKTARVAKTNTIGRFIKSVSEVCTAYKIDITITFHEGKLKGLIKSGKLEKDLKLVTSVKSSNMHAFNEKGQIIKYESYADILKAYYKVRIRLYQKRKDYLLDKYQKEMDLLKWKLKFVEGVIDKEIKINNVPKADVHARLEELGFPKFAEKPESDPDYYYTKMDIYQLTKEKVEKLRQAVKDKKKQMAILEGKSPEDIWKEELDAFMIEYDKWEAVINERYENQLNAGDNTKPKRKSKTAKVEEI